MPARPNRYTTPDKPGRSLRWWHVALVIAALILAFICLERLKSAFRGAPPVGTPTAVEPRQGNHPEYEQKIYTSVPPVPHRQPPKASPSRSYSGGAGDVAIIIDDMGSSLKEASELIGIQQPLTFAIIPGLPKARGVADAAAAAGRDVIVHLPMEPRGYPNQRMEANGLLVAMTDEEIGTRTLALLAAVPNAVGANNHMGSRFTESEDKMLPVLKILRDKGLFFVDSRTTPASVGFNLAGRLGVKSATRSVFLDNEQDVAAIKRQLSAAAELSRRKGGVVAICHPHAATIQALKEGMPELAGQGIRFVSVREMVR